MLTEGGHSLLFAIGPQRRRMGFTMPWTLSGPFSSVIFSLPFHVVLIESI